VKANVLSYVLIESILILSFASPTLGSPFQTHASAPHVERLQRSRDLTFTQVLDAAEGQAPELWEQNIRAQQADLYRKRGKSWFADSPNLVFSYYDDSPLSNTGTREMEAGMEFELWQWKTRRHWKMLGEEMDSHLQKWRTALRWTLAGKVRQSLAEVALAELNLWLAQEDLNNTEKLFATSTLLFQQGAIARESLLQIQAVLLETKQQLLAADTALVDAERRYSALSGLEKRPAEPHREILSALHSVDQDHPLLAALQLKIDLAKTKTKIERRQGKSNPSLMLGIRKEQSGDPIDDINSIGVAVSIPIGGSQSVAKRVSDSMRERVEFEVAYEKQRRELNRRLHEAAHELANLEKAIPLAKQASELGKMRWEMAKTAFDLGELRQDEVILALRKFRDYEKNYQQMLLEKEKLISQYNQSVGVLP